MDRVDTGRASRLASGCYSAVGGANSHLVYRFREYVRLGRQGGHRDIRDEH